MRQLLPFRGYRYAEEKIGDLRRVVTQPYDKISDEARRRYLGLSPANVAHVISNPNYSEAGAHFADWIREGILRQDSEPAFYIYRQQFEVSGSLLQRTGIIGLLDLTSNAAGVLRHEKVMDAPLQDRLNLISATESNDGLIFMLLDDTEDRLEAGLGEWIGQLDPVAETEDEFGVVNQLWMITDPAALASVQDDLVRGHFYIADGHHRFETAIRYAERCRERGWSPTAVESFDKRMIALFSSRSPGVVILPTHRAIRGLERSRVNSLMSQLETGFQVEKQTSLEALADSMQKIPGAMGLLLGSDVSPFLLTDQGARTMLPQTLTESARELDVNLLHQGILEPMLGIGEHELASQKHVDYYRHVQDLVPGLESGRYQMAFLLNPTSTDQVRRVSEEGGRMPQKSTDFFPKLLTGLVFMKMEINRNEEETVSV